MGKNGPMRRSRAEGGRPHAVSVSLSDLELAVVAAAAAKEGVAKGAWLGEVGVRTAKQEHAPPELTAWGPVMTQLIVERAELMEARRVLRVAGGNLNDVARHANSTGEVHAATLRVLERVQRTVDRVDEVVAGLDALVAAARRELLRSRR